MLAEKGGKLGGRAVQVIRLDDESDPSKAVQNVNGLRDGVTIIGLVGSILYLDWTLLLIAAVMYPLAAVPIQRLGKRIRRASGGMQEQMGETAEFLYQSFAQARTVRAYRLEATESARADGSGRGSRGRHRRWSGGRAGDACRSPAARRPLRPIGANAGASSLSVRPDTHQGLVAINPVFISTQTY